MLLRRCRRPAPGVPHVPVDHGLPAAAARQQARAQPQRQRRRGGAAAADNRAVDQPAAQRRADQHPPAGDTAPESPAYAWLASTSGAVATANRNVEYSSDVQSIHKQQAEKTMRSAVPDSERAAAWPAS